MKQGFVLLEMVLYLSGCCLLSCFFGLYMLDLHAVIQKQFLVTHHWLMVYTAHDKIIADIQKAFLPPASFLVIAPDQLLWSDGNKERGWSLAQGKLILTTGIYSIAQRRWLQQRKTTVAEGVTQLLFTPFRDTQNQCVGLDCVLKKEKIIVSRYSAP